MGGHTGYMQTSPYDIQGFEHSGFWYEGTNPPQILRND
jgi:hypothetical protein